MASLDDNGPMGEPEVLPEIVVEDPKKKKQQAAPKSKDETVKVTEGTGVGGDESQGAPTPEQPSFDGSTDDSTEKAIQDYISTLPPDEGAAAAAGLGLRSGDAGGRSGSTDTDYDDLAEDQDRDKGFVAVPTDSSKLVGTGVAKGFFSGVPQLYGLAGATVDYAMNKLKGGDGTFAQQMFRKGGPEAIQQEADDFRDDYMQDHPDATVQDFQNAYELHRATPQYYDFVAEQMRPGISAGMRNAMAINKLAGIDKTPDEQSTIDQIAEGMSSAVMPVGDLGELGAMASNITGRISGPLARAAVKAAQIATPGASSVTGGAIGAGVSLVGPSVTAYAASHPHGQVQQPQPAMLYPGMTDPRNGQPVTTSASTSDPVDAAHGTPSVGAVSGTPAPPMPQQQQSAKPQQTTPQPVVPTTDQPIAPVKPSTSQVVQPSTINQPADFRQGVTPGPAGLVGGALVGLGAAALALKGGKYVGSAIQRLRGGSPNVDAFGGAAIPGGGIVAAAEPRAAKIAASTNIRGNLNPPTNGTLPARVLKAIDNAINKDSYVENEARELGGDPLERIIQSQLGTKLSRDAKAQDIGRVIHNGLLPDGTAMSTVPEDFFNASTSATPEQRAQFTRLIQALNVQARRRDALGRLMNQETELVAAINRTRDPQLLQQRHAELSDVRRLMQLRSIDDPSSRITFSKVPDSVLARSITEARADPQVRDLERQYREISEDLTRYEYNSGLHSAQTATNYMQNSYYSPLFEFEDAKLRSTSGATNRDIADQAELDASPDRAIDPWSATAFRVYGAIQNGNTNVAKTRIINAFQRSDPNRNYVREVDEAGHGTVQTFDAGRRRYFQFARPDVANAINAQAIDLGRLMSYVNMLRTLRQQFITGPLFGTLYTPFRSVAFDTFATMATKREGRVFGYASSFVAHRAPLSPQAQRAAQLIGAVDPTAPLVTISGGAQAALAHAYKNVGEVVARASQNNSALWRMVGQLPGGQAFLQSMGARMAHAYDSSSIAMLERANGISMHQMVHDTLSARNELEKFMKTYENAGASRTTIGRTLLDPAADTIQTIYHGYAGFINLIHNASRYGYWLQNYALLEHQAAAQGRQVTEQEVRQLAEEVRRSAGDLAGQPGSKSMKYATSSINYLNISAQTNRHVAKAVIRDPIQVGLTVGALTTAAYLSYRSVVDRGPEAENWYWNRANPWERIGAIRFIPKPETMLYMAKHGGQLPPFDMHNPHGEFYDIPVSPEFLPWVTTALAGLEHVGLMKRPNDATSYKGDLGFSLADSLAVGTIPAVNVPLILSTGQSLNLTAGASGRSSLQGPQSGQGAGIEGRSTPGGLPFTVPMLANEVLGLGGTMVYNMADQGLNAYHQGHSLGDSMTRAAVEAEDWIKERPAIPDIPVLYDAPTKVYRSTPAMKLAMNRSDIAVGSPGKPSPLAAQWSYEYGKINPYTARSMNMQHVMDQQVLNMLSDVHNAYMRKGGIKDAREEMNEARKNSGQLDRDKPKWSITDIKEGKYRKAQQDIRLDVQTKGDTFMSATEDFNKHLADTYGDRFKKEGVPPTIEGVEALVKKYARPLQPGEQPAAFIVPQLGKKPSHHAQP